MTVLAQIATVLGERSGAQATGGFRDALAALPEAVSSVLSREAEIEAVAQIAKDARVYAAGAGPNEATALELVIKAREAALGWVDGLAIEQFLHGPAVAVNPGDLAVVIHVAGNAAWRVGEIARFLAAAGARLWIVGEPIADLPEATTFALPAVPETLSPLLAVVPMQILAYQMAALKGTHPDTFRRDDPRFKDALSLLKL
jgi:glucosamine--fructose-6-phosphate aminotransferase (isomerizing)